MALSLSCARIYCQRLHKTILPNVIAYSPNLTRQREFMFVYFLTCC
uniref:Uncharacterized protein n=1 Tax=Anguilla anguilla TaxID=7936 RepID=A0A0E9UKR5_ANGAN